MKTVPISIRLDPETREKLQEIADREMRTLNNLIKKILTEYVQEQEDSQPPPPKK